MTHSLWRMASRLAAVACMAIALPAGAADQYPTHPITIVVPYSPGGGVDIVTRLVTSHMSEELGQTIVVDNRPGGGTNIGMGYVANAKPDGYTLYTASNTLATNKALYSKLSFDPATAFTSVGKIGEAPLVVVVSQDSPFKTLGDLVEYGRQHPQDLTFGTAGVGSSGHMASELLLRSGKFKALHVPYKGGAPALTDLLGGRISFMAINPLEVVSHIQAGKLRALAVLNSDGTPLLPKLPTAQASGLGDLEATVWWGIVAPAGTPSAVVERLNAALNSALKSPDVKAHLAKLGAKEQPGTPGQFGAFVTREREKLTQVIEEAHIKAD